MGVGALKLVDDDEIGGANVVREVEHVVDMEGERRGGGEHVDNPIVEAVGGCRGNR